MSLMTTTSNTETLTIALFSINSWHLIALWYNCDISPRADFIKVLRTAFTPVSPQSVRTQSSCQYLFTLLGSTGVKAVGRTLMKLSPRVNFINILHVSFFAQKRIGQLFSNYIWLCKFLAPKYWQKCRRVKF